MKKSYPNPSLNLLKTNYSESFAIKYHFKIAALSKIVIILIEAVLVFIIGLNSKTESEISALQSGIKEKETTIISHLETEKKARDVIKRTALLKDLQSRADAIPTIKKVLGNLPKNAVLQTASFEALKAEITIETKTPVEASVAISQLLKNTAAQEIILKSAIMDVTANTFITNLELKI